MTFTKNINWNEKKLGDIADTITKGSTPTTYGYPYQNQGINFVKVEDIENTKVTVNKISKYISKEAHEFLKRSQLKKHDVLFSIAGTIGKIAFIEEDVLPANTNQALAIIRGYEIELEPKYLQYLLQSQIAFGAIQKARGGAMNNISLDDLKKLIIPYPEKAEQKRIVEKIEELLSVANAANESLRSSIMKLPLIMQSVYDKTIKSTTKTTKLKDVATDIRYGYTSKTSKDIAGVPMLRITDIQNGKVDWNEVPNCKISDEDKKKYTLKSGNIVFARSGNTVGKTHQFLNDDTPNSVYASYLIRIQLDTGVLLPEFLYFYFQSNDYWVKIRKGSAGIGQPNFNGTKLANLEVPIPTIEEQVKIVDEIKSIITVVKKSEEVMKEKLKGIDSLKQSILSNAFSGKLVN